VLRNRFALAGLMLRASVLGANSKSRQAAGKSAFFMFPP
jgi:hypothetical protein